MKIQVVKNILDANDRIADENRAFFDEKKIFVMNLMSSPGAGKTSLVEKTIEALRDQCRIAVIEGDIQNTCDADRVAALGIPAVQINTGGGCHLDANMIRRSVPELGLASGGFVFIENVGNLVCPASFDLGEDLKLVILSVSEGDDKPYKYIEIFEQADVVILNKTDLKPYIDFNDEYFVRGVRALNEDAPIFEVSCKTGQGVKELAAWLKQQNRAKLAG